MDVQNEDMNMCIEIKSEGKNCAGSSTMPGNDNFNVKTQREKEQKRKIEKEANI